MKYKKTKKSQRYQKNDKNQRNQTKKNKKVISYSKNKKGGANMNDVDIDEIGDVYDALGIKEKFGVFDSMKVDEGSLADKRTEMPQMDCVIL